MPTRFPRLLLFHAGVVLALGALLGGCRQAAEPAPLAPDTSSTVVSDGSGLTQATIPPTTDAEAAEVATTRAEVAEPVTTASSTTTTLPPWSIPDHQVAQVVELTAVTEAIRERRFLERPVFDAVGADELAERYPTGLAGPSLEELEHQLALFERLGMVGADAFPADDLLAVLRALPSDPFYDWERGTIVIPGDGEPLDEYQQWVLVGQLVHAMTHQHHPLILDSLPHPLPHDDRTAAVAALLEGEAVLVQSLYLDSLPAAQRMEVAQEAGDRARPSLDRVPPILVDLARFPRLAGSMLATELYELGGMAALDQALDHPPETTEQLLHLDRYRRQDQGVEVEPVSVSVDGYLVVEHGTWGERRWRALLERHSGAFPAAQAGEGWGGDHYALLVGPSTGGLVFVARYVADSFVDESEMVSAIRELVTSGMGLENPAVVDTVTEWAEGASYALIAWEVGEIVMVLASDPDVGRSVASQLGVAR